MTLTDFLGLSAQEYVERGIAIKRTVEMLDEIHPPPLHHND
jgi:hypothetical protein